MQEPIVIQRTYLKAAYASLLSMMGLFNCAVVSAAVKLPPIISDHMMIQANANPRIWGTADPLEKIKASYLGKTVETQADASGSWQLFLGKIAPKTSFELTIRGKNLIVIRDVLAGEVWLCAGQSNMIFIVAGATNGLAEAASTPPPAVRCFIVSEQRPLRTAAEVEGKWETFDKRESLKWSAVGFFFAKKLSARLNEPVGIIESGAGGSKIQSWMSGESLKGLPASMLSTFQRNTSAHLPPSSLFDSMIDGITRYAISGILWYQGESNVHEAEIYRNLFPLMIADWRRKWDSAALPFLFVQLPNYGDAGKSQGEWCQMRDAQTSALKLRNTAMVVSIDTGDGHIHPPNKQPIGIRLALAALDSVYHRPVDYEGPTLESLTRVGSALVCKFSHSLNQLKMNHGTLLSGFEICGPDQRFFPASALIKGDLVVVAARLVPNPAGVRYDWSDNPTGNLVNAQQFPARPFKSAITNPVSPLQLHGEQMSAAQKLAAEQGALKQHYREQTLDKYKQIQMLKHSAQ